MRKKLSTLKMPLRTAAMALETVSSGIMSTELLKNPLLVQNFM